MIRFLPVLVTLILVNKHVLATTELPGPSPKSAPQTHSNDSTPFIDIKPSYSELQDIIPTFYIKRLNGDICLMMRFMMKVHIGYFDKSGGEHAVDLYLNATTKYTHTGSCGGDNSSSSSSKEQLLSVTFQPDNHIATTYTINFTFANSSTAAAAAPQYHLTLVALNYTINDQLMPSVNETGQYTAVSNQSHFDCPIGRAFQCLASQTFVLKNTSKLPPTTTASHKASVVFSQMRVEAFRSGDKPEFASGYNQCSQDAFSNRVVPIVVGVVLAVLIAIALIVFIIGNRRRQAGYQEL